MSIKYNGNASLKKLKKLAQGQFMLGHSARLVSRSIGVSEHIIQGWHDEFVLQTLKEQPSRRIFTRELLLKNAPTAITVLAEFAKQKGDEKLAYSAASAILSFGSRFLQEDVRISNLEARIQKDNDNDPGLKHTLFDFVSPDQPLGDTGGRSKDEERDEEADLAEIEAAMARLEAEAEKKAKAARKKKGHPPVEDTQKHLELKRGASAGEPDTETEEAEDYYRSASPDRQNKEDVDLFDGIDDSEWLP